MYVYTVVLTVNYEVNLQHWLDLQQPWLPQAAILSNTLSAGNQHLTSLLIMQL